MTKDGITHPGPNIIAEDLSQAKAAAEAQRASGISGIIGGVTGGISSAVSAFGSEDFLSSGFGQLLTSK